MADDNYDIPGMIEGPGESGNNESGQPLPGMKKSFWQRNGATVITLAILGLIIGGAIAINERRSGNLEITPNEVSQQSSEEENGADSENQSGQVGSGLSTSDIAGVAVAQAIRITEVRAENGEVRASSFEVIAQTGEGRTHLARRAITEQIRRTNTDLSNEQRVYAEDYLQKKFAPKIPLSPGSTVTFSAAQVDEAIDGSQTLTTAQLKNLEKWSVLVNFPDP